MRYVAGHLLARPASHATSHATTSHDTASHDTAIIAGYIDVTEFALAARRLGFPFASDADARAAFDKIDRGGDGRVLEQDFVDWWNADKQDDALRAVLREKFMLSAAKLSDARGILFG